MILAAEAGLTILGLLAIIKQKWSVGNTPSLIGIQAIFLGFLSFITIPTVYVVTAYLHIGQVDSFSEWLMAILTFRDQGDNLNGLLIEFTVLLMWATIILGISGLFSWYNKGKSASFPAAGVFEKTQESLKSSKLGLVKEETENLWVKKSLPLSDSVDSEAMLP